MSQRCVCPSVGAIARPLPHRVVTASHCSRGFHASARKLEDKPSSSSPSTSGPVTQRGPRRQRNANAATQIGNLQFRRPVPDRSGLAGGVFPSGQRVQKNGDASSSAPKIITPRKPLIRRDSTGPPGNMVRAPSALRITRDAGPSSGPPRRGGPNLRGRGGPPGAPRGGPNRGGEAGPKRRERSDGGDGGGDAPRVDQDVIEPNQIDSSTMQLLYRLQRQQWDRKPYTPKYAPGSFEANELIHAGRELCKGESPPVKVWGNLERTLNIVGMHGAEAHLKVRRVPDGDNMPFGKEHENLLEQQPKEPIERKPLKLAA